MIDMLVRLYDLPDCSKEMRILAGDGIIVRRAAAYERHLVAAWVGDLFSPKWISEAMVAFTRQPIACHLATRGGRLLGFACYDVTSKGFLGPMGVSPDARGTGIGKTLLIKALESLRECGYAYAIIGGVGPEEFYSKTVGAMPIEGSTPGIYRDILPE